MDLKVTPRITLLDGGMGRQLLRMGAPFRQPEWSALALMEAPDLVRKAHELFAAAGSDVLTTNNYAVVPFHIGKERFLRDGAKLTQLSGQLARDAAAGYGCRVAGNLPPLFGSYRPDLFIADEASPLLRVMIESLDPHADLWLAETLSSTEEGRVVAKTLRGDPRPLWIGYTLQDDIVEEGGEPHLRSGETVAEAVRSTVEFGVEAILFNCSQPEVMAPAVTVAKRELQSIGGAGDTVELGVYANAFPPLQKEVQANLDFQQIREDLDPEGYLAFGKEWLERGATIIGGCCGIGPEHIAALGNRLT